MSFSRDTKTFLLYAVVFSLVIVSGPLSSRFQLPSIPPVWGANDAGFGSWYPAGPQMQTLSISTFTDSTAQITALQTSQIDLTDWPLTPGQIPTVCPTVAINCSSPVLENGYSGIQFNLAGNFWGVPMSYGNNPAGIQIRQGIAHLIDKISFAGNECGGQTCVADDDPTPVCNTFNNPVGTINPPCELPAANPCAWDSMFAEPPTPGVCEVGAPGGTSYHLAPAAGVNFPWQPAYASPDFCAAAQHFIAAGLALGKNGNCELFGIAPAVTANTVNIFVRNTSPTLIHLGQSLAQEICALFGQGFVTGCAPFLTLNLGPIGAFCGFATSTTGVPTNCWGMYVSDFVNVFPFDQNMYYIYNSNFASKTPGSPCAGTIFTPSAEDYPYACDSTYDSLSISMEFALCIVSPGPASDPGGPGDPLGAAVPTFANCSGDVVPGGLGATTCAAPPPPCTAISAGYQTEDYFGSHALGIPVYTRIDRYARLSNWPLGGPSSPGVIDAIGGPYEPLPNYFNWLNAYSPSPAVPGTIRQGFAQTPRSLNPFISETPQDFYVLDNVYDTLFKTNPMCSESPPGGSGIAACSSKYQLLDWMTTSNSFLCYPGGPFCTATTVGYGNATYFVGTTADLRLALNRNNHWQDGSPVTAWDVKYSFINLNATAAFQASPLWNVAHINVLDQFTLDVNLKAKGPFTDYFLGSITIIPGHVWSACGASAWNGGVTGKNLAGTRIVNAPEDSCVGTFGSPNIVTIGGVRADSPNFDPVTNGFLIGSGPWTCQNTGANGAVAIGTIGTGCSIDNTQSPAPAFGAYTLTRTGCTITFSGTTCGAAGSSSDYFRSSGALAKYIWTGDIGSGSADFSKMLTVNSCHTSSPSPNCPHWAQGIGNPGGIGSNPVGLSQRLAVNSYKGISWISFSTEKTTGTQLILACKAGYTLPGTTITPCTATNAGWTPTILPGIGAYASTLYEVGSTVLSTSTSTLTPASPGNPNCAPPAGTGSAYPNGGYDC